MPHFILYSWGANSYGQLGLGSAQDALQPFPVPEVPAAEVTAICGGGGHSLLLLRNGAVLAAGNNSRGQLGATGGNRTQFSAVPLPQKMRKIAAGWETSFAVTDSGELWAWGANSHGQLGLATSETSIGTARRVPLPGRTADVAAGSRHALAVTEDGRCFAWGLGKRGQLGVQSSGTNSPVLVQDLPPVRQCVAGDHHSAVLTENGSEAYMFGDNRFGQCGPNAAGLSSTQRPVSLPFGGAVRSLFSGWTHMTAITEEAARRQSDFYASNNVLLHRTSLETFFIAREAQGDLGQLAHKRTNLSEFQEKIRDVVRRINSTEGLLQKVMVSFRHRLHICLLNNGDHIEQLKDSHLNT